MIKRERVKKGWTQQDLANRSGNTRAHIPNIETGKFFPEYENLLRILNVLGFKMYITGGQ